MTINYLRNKKYYILASLFCLCYALGTQKVEDTCQHKAIYQTNKHDLQPVATNHLSSGEKWKWQAALLMLISGAMAAFIGIALYHAQVMKVIYKSDPLMAKQEGPEKDKEEEREKRSREPYELIKHCFDYVEQLEASNAASINGASILENFTHVRHMTQEAEDLIVGCLANGMMHAKRISTAKYQVRLSIVHLICVRDIHNCISSYLWAFYEKQEVNRLVCTHYCDTAYTKKMIPQDCVSIIAKFLYLDFGLQHDQDTIECYAGTILDSLTNDYQSGTAFSYSFIPRKSLTHKLYGQQFTRMIKRRLSS